MVADEAQRSVVFAVSYLSGLIINQIGGGNPSVIDVRAEGELYVGRNFIEATVRLNKEERDALQRLMNQVGRRAVWELAGGDDG